MKEEAFLAFWKKGVSRYRPEFFNMDETSVEACNDKNLLRPNIELIDSAIGKISRGEAILLAVMVSFYNGKIGQAMLEQIKTTNISDISWYLDRKGKEIAAGLFLNYEGW